MEPELARARHHGVDRSWRSGPLVERVSEPPPYNVDHCFHWRTGHPRAVVRVLRDVVGAEANFLMASPLWPASATT